MIKILSLAPISSSLSLLTAHAPEINAFPSSYDRAEQIWYIHGDFPDGPAINSLPYNAGTQVWSLVGELRSHMPRSNSAPESQLLSLCAARKDPARRNEDPECPNKTQCTQINNFFKKRYTQRHCLLYCSVDPSSFPPACLPIVKFL